MTFDGCNWVYSKWIVKKKLWKNFPIHFQSTIHIQLQITCTWSGPRFFLNTYFQTFIYTIKCLTVWPSFFPKGKTDILFFSINIVSQKWSHFPCFFPSSIKFSWHWPWHEPRWDRRRQQSAIKIVLPSYYAFQNQNFVPFFFTLL